PKHAFDHGATASPPSDRVHRNAHAQHGARLLGHGRRIHLTAVLVVDAITREPLLHVLDRAAGGHLARLLFVRIPPIAVGDVVAGHGTHDRADGSRGFAAVSTAHLIAEQRAGNATDDGAAVVTLSHRSRLGDPLTRALVARRSHALVLGLHGTYTCDIEEC